MKKLFLLAAAAVVFGSSIVGCSNTAEGVKADANNDKAVAEKGVAEAAAVTKDAATTAVVTTEKGVANAAAGVKNATDNAVATTEKGVADAAAGVKNAADTAGMAVKHTGKILTINPEREREAFVYLPDDGRLRAIAGRIADDVRKALRAPSDYDDVAAALAAANREATAPDAGLYASIAATARESHTLDFGPLFNPAKFLTAPSQSEIRAAAAAARDVARERDAPAKREEPELTHAERREVLRRDLRALVTRASAQFAVDHKLIHATLNQRFGGPVATATLAGLDARRKLITQWLERRVYDGMR